MTLPTAGPITCAASRPQGRALGRRQRGASWPGRTPAPSGPDDGDDAYPADSDPGELPEAGLVAGEADPAHPGAAGDPLARRAGHSDYGGRGKLAA